MDFHPKFNLIPIKNSLNTQSSSDNPQNIANASKANTLNSPNETTRLQQLVTESCGCTYRACVMKISPHCLKKKVRNVIYKQFTIFPRLDWPYCSNYGQGSVQVRYTPSQWAGAIPEALQFPENWAAPWGLYPSSRTWYCRFRVCNDRAFLVGIRHVLCALRLQLPAPDTGLILNTKDSI